MCAGLSLALGAFLAGLLLAETEYALQVESDIAPYKGLLMGLFFMTVGECSRVGVYSTGSSHVGTVFGYSTTLAAHMVVNRQYHSGCSCVFSALRHTDSSYVSRLQHHAGNVL
jgi:predicted Kef-type K+ transport protein